MGSALARHKRGRKKGMPVSSKNEYLIVLSRRYSEAKTAENH
jgi:hypothetical protein